jgi:Protein of unknown function (DUF3467)
MAEQNLITSRAVPIQWHFPDDIVSRYATNLVVQHTEHEFSISFFEVRPPILVGSPEDIQAALQRVESVPAVCIARIIVAAERMPEFLRVLQDNLAQYQAKARTSE